ncbi:hypothetical protein BMF94_5065 [Rhodotorula taiwanensis]|uniref:Uncharacterized protein n=1 Tax=Rhodotorula taiwanensis TaxID=741276 RepID=A0A2S5B555_9BASI|nr:hypothetical protein BMF94_5065 [Rhodotorula taiwanensis]
MSNSPQPAPVASTSTAARATQSPQPQSKLIAPPKRIEPSAATAAKPKNLFSNDGSFLERFKKAAVPTPDQERKEREEALARKKALEDRFKNRGKRPAAGTASGSKSTSPGVEESDPSKRRRTTGNGDADRPLTEYEKEVRKLEARHLKDEGSSLRSLMK